MKAYLFDVDGVLSDPKAKQVTEPELFDHIISRLQDGNQVCLNTGRSIAWTDERVITPLIEKMNEKTLLTHFIASGEKGGTWMTFDKNGKRNHERDKTITVPQTLVEEVRTIVERDFAKSMFFDDTKETMISIEMRDYFDIGEYHKDQKRLKESLEQLLEKHRVTDVYKIDPTIIAIDVENKHVGKALGADRFLQFLGAKGVNPDEYFAFGDSKRDIEMADEIAKRGKKVEFIFVGDKEKLAGVKRDYKIECIAGFSKGTLAYLNR